MSEAITLMQLLLTAAGVVVAMGGIVVACAVVGCRYVNRQIDLQNNLITIQFEATNKRIDDTNQQVQALRVGNS